MGLQDDIFDINDNLEGGVLEDAFHNLLTEFTRLENENARLTQLILDFETTIKTLKSK